MHRACDFLPHILANDGLTPRQRRFIAEYLADKGRSGTQAAIRAGYSPKGAEVQASRLLSLVKVRDEIARRLKAQEQRLELRSDDVLRELLRIATADIGKAFDEEGKLRKITDIPEDVRRAISGWEVDSLFAGSGSEKFEIGVTTKVKFWDKNKSLELLGKHLKLFTDVVEHQGKLTLEQLVTESQGDEE